MFEARLSKFLFWLSRRLWQKSLYFELKSHIKRGGSYFRVVRPTDRGAWKTHSLIQLAHKYDYPIAVSSEEWAKHLRGYSLDHFNKPVKTVVCNSLMAGMKFKTVLCEEGISYELLNTLLIPNAERVVGYRASY
jgi:hypothetical protein